MTRSSTAHPVSGRGRPRRWLTFAAALFLVGGAGACGGTGDGHVPAAPSARAGSEAPAEIPGPGDHELTMEWAGKSRRYLLHVPASFTGADRMPLVVVLHYLLGTPEIMKQMTGFDELADDKGFMVAYPAGIDNRLEGLTEGGGNDDVGFITAMVRHLEDAWKVDPDRVYATGASIGAEGTFLLAVRAPGVFAAIAPVSGGFAGNKAADDPSFVPSTPVSVVSFIGYDDRDKSASLTGLDIWRHKLGCTPVEDPAWIDAGHTVSRSVSRCRDGSDVVSYVLRGMSHSWPGGQRVGLGDPDTAIKATPFIWTFFAAHPRRD